MMTNFVHDGRRVLAHPLESEDAMLVAGRLRDDRIDHVVVRSGRVLRSVTYDAMWKRKLGRQP